MSNIYCEILTKEELDALIQLSEKAKMEFDRTLQQKIYFRYGEHPHNDNDIGTSNLPYDGYNFTLVSYNEMYNELLNALRNNVHEHLLFLLED